MTLTRNFMETGYDVEGCGKIQHGTPSHEQWHLWKGYNEFPWENTPIRRPGWGVPLEGGDELTGEYKMVEWAKERLAVQRDRPLFLGVGFVRPHLPWNAPKKYFDMFPPEKVTLPKVKEDDLADVPPIGREMAKGDVEKFEHAAVLRDNLWRNNVSAYLASITYADAQLGRLIEAWDRSPLSENGVVVLWSDHGWHLGEKLHWRKFSLWEEATRNILLFVGPKQGIARGRCARSVGLQDIYPTLMDMCKLQPRNDLDGHSLVPLLSDPTHSWEWPALTTHKYGNHSVRTERWRYTRYRDGGEELYDHDADPMEWTNLAADPELAHTKKELAHWLPVHDAPEVPYNRRK
jgi:arylsulfatase A-like enzyme